jgi:hypothetical protein
MRPSPAGLHSSSAILQKRSMKTDLYIYYRARCEHAANLLDCAASLQRRVKQEYGIVTALKRRPEIKNGMHTWMEVYLDVPPGFEEKLTPMIAEAGLIGLIDGERHTETFLDYSACA